jgi:SAM-dependent methyltransferase
MLQTWKGSPSTFLNTINEVPTQCAALAYSRDYTEVHHPGTTGSESASNPLWDYFQNHKTGHGIWKWEHYFDIYHRHLSKFIGASPTVLEIGIFSGGSLQMWRSYFGEKTRVYGVDIEPACTAYESDDISVLIGDQGDRKFWASCKAQLHPIDVLIDDGGHTVDQQRLTLEEMLPFIRPGGVYLCEDIHGDFNRFAVFAGSLVNELNRVDILSESPLLKSAVSPFQRSIHSIHFYPYVLVIEKNPVPVTNLSAPKHGTEWQPFL